MDKESTYYTFLATGAFATVGAIVGFFVKLISFLVKSPYDNIFLLVGGIVLAILCLFGAAVSLVVLRFAMRRIKQINDKAQKEHDKSDKRLQELQELQIDLLKSKLASVTAQGDVVIKDGKLVIDVSNKNIVVQVDSSSHQYGSQINLTIKSDEPDKKAEHHSNSDTDYDHSVNISDKEK